MRKVRLSIIYYSMTGSNHQLALWAKDAAEAAGAEVRVRKVQELAPREAVEKNPVWLEMVDNEIPVATGDDLTWADAILFSTPTRFGNVASQLKQFLDTTGRIWSEGKLNDKVVSAMATAQNDHGGQEQTLLQLYTSMYHWGALICPPGYTDPVVYGAGGNPYGTSATIGKDGIVNPEGVKAAAEYQARRMVAVAEKMI